MMRSPILIFHICGGVAGVVSGFAAMSFRKGSRWHGIAGHVFFVAMLAMGLSASYLGVQKGQSGMGGRVVRHLWRMCVSFFVATGSFFLGQQQVFPKAWRGSAVWFIPAFLPLIVMIYWLVRLGSANSNQKSKIDNRQSLHPPATARWYRLHVTANRVIDLVLL